MSTPEKALQCYVDEQAESAKLDYQERWAANYAALQTGYERQAELLLAGYLLTISDGYKWVDFCSAWDVHTDSNWSTIMGYRVEVNGHTADFLFRCCHGNDRRLLAVTLDAQDRRQRAPEAIARDRGLMDAGCRVINYTDAQVLVEAVNIAEEISGALTNLVDEMLSATGHIRKPRPTNVTQIGRRSK